MGYIDGVRHDLHGETVGLIHTTPVLGCDYCGSVIDATEPILYEAFHVINLTTLETLLNPPEGWILDAVRCRDCTIAQFSPATIGYDETLILLRVTDVGGVLSVDASMLKVIDLSPGNDGYFPPQLGTYTLVESDDVGSARWLRICAYIGHLTTVSLEQLSAVISRSNEIPLGINV